VAEPQHPGLSQRAGDQEDEGESRVDQKRGGREDLPDRDVEKFFQQTAAEGGFPRRLCFLAPCRTRSTSYGMATIRHVLR